MWIKEKNPIKYMIAYQTFLIENFITEIENVRYLVT